MFHIYKITNKLTGKFFIGYFRGDKSLLPIRQRDLRADIKLLGDRNFSKEILSSFSNKDQMKREYKSIVNRDLFKQDVYNLNIYDKVPVKDKYGNRLMVSRDHPKYKSGEYTHVLKGTVTVKDPIKGARQVSREEYLNSNLENINKGREHHQFRGKFRAKDSNGNIFLITKDDIRYKEGLLRAVSKRNKIKTIKEIKKTPRKKPENRENFIQAQLEYRVKKRKEAYPLFEHSIYSKEGNFLIKDFCKHGDLLISKDLFEWVYFKENNNKELYCDQCRDEYLKNLKLSEEDIKSSRNLLIQFYKKGSSSLKENYIYKHYPILYKCIQDNINKDISWVEKIFLFKEGLREIPKCLAQDCNKNTFFSPSNQRYTKFCKKHLNGFSSSGENELFDYVKNLCPNATKWRFDGIELDVFVPELNKAFEFNGLYWHCDIYKEKSYHYEKWKKCRDNGIQLISIWEDDWNFKREIVKSIILNSLGLSPNRVYARECSVEEINGEDSKVFLENNHIQGNCSSSIKLGLTYNGKLISIMTFGKRNLGKSCQFELLRFCSILNTNVVGGASKLFSYFLKTNRPERVVSYSSCDISQGNLYSVLGFKEGEHYINYWWSNNSNRYPRNRFMKHKLVKEGFDPNKSEDEIMRERKYNKIYGTGNIKYEYINKLK